MKEALSVEEIVETHTETFEVQVTPEEKQLLDSGDKVLTINNVFADVAEFIEAFNQETLPEIGIPSGDLLDLRKRLIDEEWTEIKDAIEAGNVAGYVDGCIDLIYVVAGALLTAGVPACGAQQLWETVHKANMAKAGGPKDENGKQLKPEGWTPPDIEGELEKIKQYMLKKRTESNSTD